MHTVTICILCNSANVVYTRRLLFIRLCFPPIFFRPDFLCSGAFGRFFAFFRLVAVCPHLTRKRVAFTFPTNKKNRTWSDKMEPNYIAQNYVACYSFAFHSMRTFIYGNGASADEVFSDSITLYRIPADFHSDAVLRRTDGRKSTATKQEKSNENSMILILSSPASRMSDELCGESIFYYWIITEKASASLKPTRRHHTSTQW